MDDFENELGWSEIGEPANDEPAPEPKAQREPARASSSASASTGMAQDSPLRIDMGREPEPADEAEEPTPAPQSRAPKVVAPSIDYRQLAQELTQAQIVASQALRPAGPDPYQEHVATMLQKGAEPEAVKTLDRMVELKLQQAQVQAQQYAQQSSAAAYTQHVDAIFESAIDDVTEVPQLRALAPSIRQKAIEVWSTDPEFAQEFQRMQQGKPPNPKIAKRVATKASDAVCAAAGLNLPQKPVSLQSSKPSRSTARSTSTAGGVESLDREQRAYYDAFRGSLGNARALQSAKRIGR